MGRQIISDPVQAQARATALSSATSAITSVGDTSRDDSTTVGGNNTAHEKIALEKTVAEDICQQIEAAAQNIQSICSEFEAADNAIKNQMNQQIGGGLPLP